MWERMFVALGLLFGPLRTTGPDKVSVFARSPQGNKNEYTKYTCWMFIFYSFDDVLYK